MSIDQDTGAYSLPLNTNGLGGGSNIFYANKLGYLMHSQKYILYGVLIALGGIGIRLFWQVITGNVATGLKESGDTIVLLVSGLLQLIYFLFLSPGAVLFWVTGLVVFTIIQKLYTTESGVLTLVRFNPKDNTLIKFHLLKLYKTPGRIMVGVESKRMNRIKKFILASFFGPERYPLRHSFPTNKMDAEFIDWSFEILEEDIPKSNCFFVDDFEHSGAIIELIEDEITGEIQADLSLSAVMTMDQMKFIHQWGNWGMLYNIIYEKDKRIIYLEQKVALGPGELALKFHSMLFLKEGIELTKRLLPFAKESDTDFDKLVGREKSKKGPDKVMLNYRESVETLLHDAKEGILKQEA